MTKLLVVDDEKQMTDAWVIIINKFLKIECKGVYHPDEALKIIEEEKPPFLIVDFNLKADLNGIEVYHKAKEANPNLKAIMVSGNADDPEVRFACKDAGIAVLLDKPITLEELMEHVKTLVKE